MERVFVFMHSVSQNSSRLLSRKADDANGGQPLYRRGDPSQFLIDIESSSDKNDHNLPPALINLIRSVK